MWTRSLMSRPCVQLAALVGAFTLFASPALADGNTRYDVTAQDDGAPSTISRDQAVQRAMGELQRTEGSFTPGPTDTVRDLTVQVGKSISVSESGLSKVAVGNPQIADLHPIGATDSFEVKGFKPGQTMVIVWAGTGRTFYRITVEK